MITPGRSQVPAENGHPVDWLHCGHVAGYTGFLALDIGITFFLRGDSTLQPCSVGKNQECGERAHGITPQAR